MNGEFWFAAGVATPFVLLIALVLVSEARDRIRAWRAKDHPEVSAYIRCAACGAGFLAAHKRRVRGMYADHVEEEHRP